MASITIRNLDDGLKRRLRVRAAENGRSMEEEARDILRRTVGETPLRKTSAGPSTPASPPSAAWISNFPNAARCGRRPNSGERLG